MTEGSDKSRGQHLLNTMAKPSRAPTDPPTVQLCALVNSLTGVSTRRLRQAFPGRKCENLWNNHFCSPASTSTAYPPRATHTAAASRHGLARRAGRHDALRGPGLQVRSGVPLAVCPHGYRGLADAPSPPPRSSGRCAGHSTPAGNVPRRRNAAPWTSSIDAPAGSASRSPANFTMFSHTASN